MNPFEPPRPVRQAGKISPPAKVIARRTGSALLAAGCLAVTASSAQLTEPFFVIFAGVTAAVVGMACLIASLFMGL